MTINLNYLLIFKMINGNWYLKIALFYFYDAK